MIDEEKIKAATDVVFADVLSPKANICMSAGFIRGIEWFKEAIWHDAKEEPEEQSLLSYNGSTREKSVMKQTEHSPKLIGRITLWITTSLSGVMSKIC